MTSSNNPGWPDLTLATGARVREALAALLTEARLGRRWHGLTDESRSAHRHILRAFVASGGPPEISAFFDQVLSDLVATSCICHQPVLRCNTPTLKGKSFEHQPVFNSS